MKRTLSLVVALLAAAPLPIRADDGWTGLKAGGLVLEKGARVTLVAEDLYLSEASVRTDYRFRNPSGTDVETVLTFPLPDLVGGPAMPAAIPDPASDNFLRFDALIDGRPAAWQLDQHAVLTRDGRPVEVTDTLKALGIPLVPTTRATEVALRRLSEPRRQTLIQAGLLERQVHPDGTIADVPLWTLRSRFWRKQVFPAGGEVAIRQSYMPVVGGQPSLSFGGPDLTPSRIAAYADRFCTDSTFARGAQALYRRASADGSRSFQAVEAYLSHVISPEDGWAGPIGTFTLTVDRGDPATMVSFCGGTPRKTGPTTSELVLKDYVPRREIDVLFLKPAGW